MEQVTWAKAVRAWSHYLYCLYCTHTSFSALRYFMKQWAKISNGIFPCVCMQIFVWGYSVGVLQKESVCSLCVHIQHTDTAIGPSRTNLNLLPKVSVNGCLYPLRHLPSRRRQFSCHFNMRGNITRCCHSLLLRYFIRITDLNVEADSIIRCVWFINLVCYTCIVSRTVILHSVMLYCNL